MISAIKEFFTPPIFEDEEKTRIASNLFLLLKIGLGTILLIWFSGIIPNRPFINLFVFPAGILIALLELAIIKKGYVRQVVIMFLSATWLMVNFAVLDGGGVRAPGFGVNLVLVLAAGMLFSIRAALFLSIASSLAGFGMAIAETRGMLPQVAIGMTAFTAWIVHSSILGFTVGLLYLTVNYIKRSMFRARHAEARLRGIVENTPDYLLEIDRTGKIIFINRYAETYVGKNIRDVLLTNQLDHALTTIDKAFDSGKPQSIDLQTIAPDGHVTWDSIRIGPIKHEGSVTSLTIIMTDITIQKEAQAKIEQAYSELEIRNAELERFTYTVSHELKTPVVTMKGFIGSIENDLRVQNIERAVQDLARVSSAADKMHDTLSDLLELSKLGHITNPPVEIDIFRLIQDALDNVDAQIRSKNVNVNVAPDFPPLYGDSTRLREVFENLIINSVSYIGSQKSPQIEIGTRDGEEPIFFIKDNGIGIEPKYHKKIFGLFEKLDPASEGTGVGLALVKRIIEMHGGDVWVESDGLGKGSTFCFTIPNREKPND